MKFEALGLESSDIERLHDQALEIIDESRINELDFIEPYGAETVARDLKRVEERERHFGAERDQLQAENKRLATIFEAIVLEHGELSNWFGENAVTIATSKYDDYENGVDAVVEFQGHEPNTASHLGLALDVTFTTDTTKKFDRLRAQVKSGELAKVKYFHSEHMNIHGQLSKLPEVVVGASKKTVMELAELWAGKKNSVLSEHRIQIMILHQIQEQLDAFARYAMSLGDHRSASVYTERLRIIDEILESKKDLEGRVTYNVTDDEVHAEIMNFLARWKHQIAVSTAAA
jgi:hypothetical protein